MDLDTESMAAAIGVSVSVLRFLLCFVATIPVSFIHRFIPSRFGKHLYVTGNDHQSLLHPNPNVISPINKPMETTTAIETQYEAAPLTKSHCFYSGDGICSYSKAEQSQHKDMSVLQ